MSLRFNRLAIRNFGPYLGSQEMDLTTTESAPVILVYGENTLGKTQLFSALRWAFYGTFTPQQTPDDAAMELPERLNRAAALEGEDTLEVSIDFEAAGNTYVLTRRGRIVDGRAEVSADLRIGATVVPAGGIEAEIGRLLHPQISEFFLFDAELLQRFYERLASDRERSLIRDSIETVLGIPALQRAQHDVHELASNAMDRQAKEVKNVDEAARLRERLKKLKDESRSVEKDRSDLEGQMAQAQAEQAKVRQKLKLVEGLEADVREQELLEAGLADGRREEVGLREEMRTLLGAGWQALAVRPLLEALTKVQDQNSRFQANERAINEARTRVAVLEDRARGGICPSCDQPLPPPDDATAHQLAEAQERLDALRAAAGGGTLDIQLERRITALVDERTIGEYTRKHRRLTDLQILQYERKQRLDNINDRLQGSSAADIRVLGQQSQTLEEAITTLEGAQVQNEGRAKQLGSDQQRLARQLDKLPGAKPEVVFETAFFRYVEAVLRGTIAEYREKVRVEVETDAESMFLKLVRDPEGHGGLRIGDDYKIELLDKRGVPRATSEGGKQLLALALIGALKMAAVRGGPVVLDSPLARLDLEHRANVLQTWIPSLGAQAMLLVQSGELTKEDASRILGPLVGQAYEIVRPGADPEIAVIERVS